ncbi:MAG: hypothetical protein K6U80_10970 [Firmicutes bacterium]|nr:hypothetical protein [Bacillota bacterium]
MTRSRYPGIPCDGPEIASCISCGAMIYVSQAGSNDYLCDACRAGQDADSEGEPENNGQKR